MEAMLSKEEFKKALEAARKPEHGVMHPFSLAWARGD